MNNRGNYILDVAVTDMTEGSRRAGAIIVTQEMLKRGIDALWSADMSASMQVTVVLKAVLGDDVVLPDEHQIRTDLG